MQPFLLVFGQHLRPNPDTYLYTHFQRESLISSETFPQFPPWTGYPARRSEHVAMIIIIMFIHIDEADKHYVESRDILCSNTEAEFRPTRKVFSTKGFVFFVIHFADFLNHV